MLGGVTFPDFPQLDGHSDADAVYHAIADALLGAAGLGDIGEHFPDDSECWRDADSRQILSLAVRWVRECRELEPYNVDVNVLAQRPRIGERKKEMRRNIACLLDLPRCRVNVKARTGEKVGPIGRGEAIAAQAVVLLEEINGKEEED